MRECKSFAQHLSCSSTYRTETGCFIQNYTQTTWMQFKRFTVNRSLDVPLSGNLVFLFTFHVTPLTLREQS